MRLISLAGDPYTIGLQHARQIQDLRGQLVAVMAGRLADLRQRGADRTAELAPAVEALEALDPSLRPFLQGLAAGLELPPADLLCYTLSSYLIDRAKVRAADPPATSNAAAEGCTTWAAAGATTASGNTLLVKNRDYHQDHIPLQLLAAVEPTGGFRYLTIGSAGSPNVFSSGINQRGLAVADTHVLSRDLGPGLPRYLLMRMLLERFDAVQAALDFLRSVRHMGGGTMILADAWGHLAVWESGHRSNDWEETRGGHLASTNHFVTPVLAGQWLEDEPPALQGNSPARRQRVLASLAGAEGRVDVPWAQALMSAHGSARDALCRHPLPPDVADGGHGSHDSSTISAAVFLPGGDGQSPHLWVAEGLPCRAAWQGYVIR